MACFKCETCAYGDGGCLAAMHDDDYYPATKEQAIKRLDENKFSDKRQNMIEYLKDNFQYDYCSSKIKRNINVVTLEYICNQLANSYGGYSFEKPLQVCYRMIDPDCQEGLFGYCEIIKKMSGYSIESRDGDDYSMSDEVILWQFNNNKLTVWVPCEWGEN